MKINFKLLTIALTLLSLITIPFVKAQPTPPTCLEVCTSFCTAYGPFNKVVNNTIQNISVLPTPLQQSVGKFLGNFYEQNVDAGSIALCGPNLTSNTCADVCSSPTMTKSPQATPKVAPQAAQKKATPSK
ncbi:MAG: hypothetical protein HYX35_03430 [Proteobacteria bacterium]|nr:hypothetical protein [Pseudomonadota bacterium]